MKAQFGNVWYDGKVITRYVDGNFMVNGIKVKFEDGEIHSFNWPDPFVKFINN